MAAICRLLGGNPRSLIQTATSAAEQGKPVNGIVEVLWESRMTWTPSTCSRAWMGRAGDPHTVSRLLRTGRLTTRRNRHRPNLISDATRTMRQRPSLLITGEQSPSSGSRFGMPGVGFNATTTATALPSAEPRPYIFRQRFPH
jgi:hypothetical protein